MESELLKILAEYGPIGVMLAWTNFLLLKFVNKTFTLSEKNSGIIANNTAALHNNSKILDNSKKALILNEMIIKKNTEIIKRLQ